MKVFEGQSLLDAALQKCGSIESLILFAQKNNISITDELLSGTDLLDPDVNDQDIVDYYSKKNLHPATAITGTQYNKTISMEGIEYWIIEKDFIVS